MIMLLVLIFWLRADENFPVRDVVLVNKLQQQDFGQLYQLIEQSIEGNFFTLDLEHLRQKIETLPWVAAVRIQKKWPHSLYLTIREKQVVARWINTEKPYRSIKMIKDKPWDKQTLLSSEGEVFSTRLTTAQLKRYQKLVRYAAPLQLSAKVLHLCRLLQQKLDRADLLMEKCYQDQRRSWYVKLNNGFELYLGRDINKDLMGEGINHVDKHIENRILQRMQIFVSAYRQVLKQHQHNIDRIDLRYTNGFAVHWVADKRRNKTTMKG